MLSSGHRKVLKGCRQHADVVFGRDTAVVGLIG